MKKAASLIFLPVLLLTACLTTEEITWPTYTEDDTGSIIQMQVGDEFEIDLNDPGDGGYSFDEPMYETDHMQILNAQDSVVGLTEEGQEQQLGDFGRNEWTFQAIAPGSTDIVITATRPWDESDYVIIFEGTFEVE